MLKNFVHVIILFYFLFVHTVKAGWGDWAGPGASEMVSQKIQDKRQKLLTQVQSENNKKKLVRKDNKILNVHINERKIKTAAKFKIADLPHPFTSWEQYERSLQMPLGGAVLLSYLFCLFI